MTKLGFLLLVFLIPICIIPAYAENSWVIDLHSYESINQSELFQPLELPISSGDSVTWINQESTTHRIVSGVPNHPDYAGEFFDSDLLLPGEAHTEYFPFEGFAGYYYFCEIHPWYSGKIFFEDNPNVEQSTREIKYEQKENEIIVKGVVDSDLATTDYEVIVYNKDNELLFQKLSEFTKDAEFEMNIDISDSKWEQGNSILLKLVYGVPSESTNVPINIFDEGITLKNKSIEFCDKFNSDANFNFEGKNLPNWYKKPLCWFGDDLIQEKEVTDSLNYF